MSFCKDLEVPSPSRSLPKLKRIQPQTSHSQSQTCLCLSSLCPVSINQKASLAGHRGNKGRTVSHTQSSEAEQRQNHKGTRLFLFFAWNLKTCSLDLFLDGSPTPYAFYLKMVAWVLWHFCMFALHAFNIAKLFNSDMPRSSLQVLKGLLCNVSYIWTCFSVSSHLVSPSLSRTIYLASSA